MAIDPVSGAQYIPTQRPEDVGPTSDAIKQQREYAAALMKQKYTPPNSKWPFYTWANGASDAANTILGAWNMKDADEREKRQYAGSRDAGTPVIGQTGNTASGGAASTSPFPQASQAGSPEPSPSTRAASRETGVSSDADPTSAAAMRLHTKAETAKNGMAALFN